MLILYSPVYLVQWGNSCEIGRDMLVSQTHLLKMMLEGGADIALEGDQGNCFWSGFEILLIEKSIVSKPLHSKVRALKLPRNP